MDFKQNKDFQALESTIISLNRQLGDLEQYQLQDINGPAQQILDHFQKCAAALIARKDSLISQLEEFSQRQGKMITKMKDDLNVCIETCKHMQTAGIKVFNNRPDCAAQLWRGVLSLGLPSSSTVDELKLCAEIDLPTNLLKIIGDHGIVKTSLNTSLKSDVREASIQNASIALVSSEYIDNGMPEKNLNELDLTISFDSSYNPLSSFFGKDKKNSAIELNTRPRFNSLPAITQPPLPLPLQPIQDMFSEVDMVTTFAGSISGNKDKTGGKAQFSYPCGICFNPNDECFYICDGNNKAIRKMNLQGDVSTITKWRSGCPQEIAIYRKDNTLFATYFNSIVKITITGKVEVWAGEVAKSGQKDGVGANAKFYQPSGITIDQKSGNIYVCDWGNHLIRMITQNSEVFTVAGLCEGNKDANGRNAQFNKPIGICYNEIDNSLMVCDTGNNQIRQISANGDVSTACKGIDARRIAVTSNGKYLISSNNNKIFMMETKGGKYELREIAGSGARKTVDGVANECSFNWPRCIAVHEPSNSCYVTEFDGHKIRKITFCKTIII